jgi:diketogulonate reductase-like aldo/keto reductase
LAEIAGETGKTAAQVALNWVADQDGVIAIPKSNSVARTEENCAASGWHLTGGQRQRLNRAFSV